MRRRNAAKREAGAAEETVDGTTLDALGPALRTALDGRADLDVEALHHALERMERDPALAAKSRVVELRFFAGLTIEQTAEALARSTASIKRDWEFCRA